ncbi:hypothetical protein [Novosphingobium guangzhouense]|uniref:Uncharacterized protein n=1 Tax=Novosphingobium guangzhouense TaxID=1850347 RepID=A0A2K2G585_9SPHN|nr:hypothetical protein [Novosphingobium guangzhouense]PNU06138.1 hypothetical protein A8V01_12310 [Novosphingobium guangzhouense]
MTETAETAGRAKALGVALRLGGGFFLAIFGAGIAAGVFSAWQEHGEWRSGVLIGLALAALALATGAWLMLSVRGRIAMPRSPRVRRSRIVFYVSMIVSVALGLLAGIGGQVSDGMPDSHAYLAPITDASPIGRVFAVALLIGWVVVMAVSIYWHMTLDEIERAEYEFGAVLALYGYITITPVWWVAWRGGILPEPNQAIVFVAVCIIWCIGWGWRRWR